MADGSVSVADATPREAHDAVAADAAARIVDVRTRPELAFTGQPAVRGMVAIEWQSWPQMQVASDFAESLEEVAPDKAAPLYFLCRSGVRSLAAARLAASLGYQRCFNITDGFEGPPDGDGHRGTVAGWKASGLPWRQP